MTRIEMTKTEMQKDPIFLFQRRRVWLCEHVHIETDGQYIGDPITGEELSEDDLIDKGWGYAHWETDSVFYSREAAEYYGERNAHNFGEKNKNWRVYCVSAMGKLADILNENGDK